MDELCKRRVYPNYINAMNTTGKSKVGTVENQLNKKGGKSKGVGVALSKKKKAKKTGKKAGKKTKKKTDVDGDKKVELDFRQNDTIAAAEENGDQPLTDPCPKKVCKADDTVVESAPCKGVTYPMEYLGRRHVRTAGDENGNCRRRVCDDNGEMTAEGNYYD